MLVLAREIEELAAALTTVQGLDPVGLAASSLNNLEALLEIRHRLDAVTAHVLAAVDDVGATVEESGRLTRSWLVEDQLLSPRAATERMRLARGLAACPDADRAFTAGQISDDHALLVVRTVTKLPEHLRAIVDTTVTDLCRQFPAYEVARMVDEILVGLGVIADEDERFRRRYEKRGLHLDDTIAGFAAISGTISPEVREALRVALDAAAALGPHDPDDDRSMAQRRHDALGDLATHYLASHHKLADTAGERPRVIVTVDYATLMATLESDARTKWAMLESGLRLSPEAARRLACDAEILPSVLGSRSQVLDLGRATRAWTTSQIRASRIRDGHRCAYPDCRRPPRQLHHMTHWAHGGPTDLDNGVWLCTFHHWLMHEGGWHTTRDPDSGFAVFTAPDGRQRRQHAPPPHPRAA